MRKCVPSAAYKHMTTLRCICHFLSHSMCRCLWSHSVSVSNLVLLSVPRGLPRSLQQQRPLHPGSQRMALHLPAGMEGSWVSRCHGNTLYRWQRQWRRYFWAHRLLECGDRWLNKSFSCEVWMKMEKCFRIDEVGEAECFTLPAPVIYFHMEPRLGVLPLIFLSISVFSFNCSLAYDN